MAQVMEVSLTTESEGYAQDGLITLRNDNIRLKKEIDELRRQIHAAEVAEEDNDVLAAKWISMDTELHHQRIANSELHSLVAKLEEQLFTFKIAMERKQDELNQLSAVKRELGASKASLSSYRANTETLASMVQDLSMENQGLKHEALGLQQQILALQQQLAETKPVSSKKSSYNPTFIGNLSKSKTPSRTTPEDEPLPQFSPVPV